MVLRAGRLLNRNWLGLVGIGVLIGSLAGIGVTPVQAYEQLGPNTRSDFRLWTPVYLTVKLPSKFIAYMEVNPRIGDDVTNIDQLLLRPAIGYQLTEHLSLCKLQSAAYAPSVAIFRRKSNLSTSQLQP
jgi:hypothetical protein